MLRAFAETARGGSLAAAARAINVTPSAVSHLLRQLEQALDLSLNAGNGRLTEIGHQLGRRLIAAFDTIDAAVIEARHHSNEVRVSALSSFLTLWLVPRLAGFQVLHPETRLLLSTGLRPVDLAAEPFECAIRWGRGGWPGLDATLLFRDRPVVVTNPRLLLDHGRLDSLPRLGARTRATDWPRVAAALGWPDADPVLTFETRALAVQAAMAGIGAAVVDRNLVADMLDSGLLAEIAPDPPLLTSEGHWFVALPDRLRVRPVRQFRDWLVTRARDPDASAIAGFGMTPWQRDPVPP